MTSKKGITYRDAGVDIGAGEELVGKIKSLVRETHNSQVLSDIGGFGGLFAPDLSEYRQPVFVSSVDGVGTKLIVAFKTGRFDTVGKDLVNHCVNDIAVCGAKPLFFLDYFSTGKLDKRIGYDVIRGFSIACKENGVALIGGETAEMPDLYKEGEFDLAGTVVGIVDRSNVITGEKIGSGDILVAVPSSGLHTNGYSLARKVLFREFDVNDQVPELGTTVADALLSIHRSYLPVISDLSAVDGVHGFSHITGGGIEGNTKRILPEGLELSVEWDAWTLPPLFQLIRKIGPVPDEEMRATFNLGAGLVIVVARDSERTVTARLRELGEEPFVIGSVVSSA